MRSSRQSSVKGDRTKERKFRFFLPPTIHFLHRLRSFDSRLCLYYCSYPVCSRRTCTEQVLLFLFLPLLPVSLSVLLLLPFLSTIQAGCYTDVQVIADPTIYARKKSCSLCVERDCERGFCGVIEAPSHAEGVESSNVPIILSAKSISRCGLAMASKRAKVTVCTCKLFLYICLQLIARMRPYGSVAERSPSKRKVHSSILCGGNLLFLPARNL